MAYLPVFVYPYPQQRAITILPPPPVGPPLPGSFSFLPPTASCGIPGADGPLVSSGWPYYAPLTPAPMPPGPSMLPLPSAPGPVQFPFTQAHQPPQPVQATQPLLPPQGEPPAKSVANSEPPKPDAKTESNAAPSTHSVQHGKSIHTFKPKKGPISKSHREALSDFEERTRLHEYRDLASKKSSVKSEPSQAKNTANAPRPIPKPVIQQEIHVNIHNPPKMSPARGQRGAGNDCADDDRPTRPAQTSASIREEAIKEANSLARSIAASAAAHAAATMVQRALSRTSHPAPGSAAPANSPSAPGSHQPGKSYSVVSRAASANQAKSVHPSQPSCQASSNQSGPRPIQGPAPAPSMHSQSQHSHSFYPAPIPILTVQPPSHHSAHSHLSQRPPPSVHSHHTIHSKQSHPFQKSQASKKPTPTPPPTLAEVTATAKQRPLSVENWRDGVRVPIGGRNVPVSGLVVGAVVL